MKKILLLSLSLLPLFSLAQFKVPERFQKTDIHDYTNLLSNEEKDNLNNVIQSMRKNSVEMAVIILPDLQGYEVSNVAIAIGRAWGVGKKDINNGIVYLIVPSLHKANISIGYGLESVLTDALTSEIQDEAKPYYKQLKYYEGITHVLNRLTEVMSPEYKNQQLLYEQKLKKENEQAKADFIFVVEITGLILLIGLLFYLMWRQAQRRKKLEEEDRLKKLAILEKNIKNANEVSEFYSKYVAAIHSNIDNNYNVKCLSISAKRIKYGLTPLSIQLYINQILLNCTLKEININEVTNKKLIINSYSKTIEKTLNNANIEVENIIFSEKQFNENIKTLPSLYEQAKNHLTKTPYKEDKLGTKTYNNLIGHQYVNSEYIDANNSLKQLLKNYDEIINYEKYEAEKLKKKQDEENAAKKKKQNEEEEQRRRDSYVISTSTYNNSPSNSSNNDYGGGSFGGGGSNSSW